jgi:hypothetical protein
MKLGDNVIKNKTYKEDTESHYDFNTFVKEHIKVIIWIIIIFGIFFISFIMFQLSQKNPLDWGSFLGGSLSYIGTVILGLCTIFVTKKLDKSNSEAQKRLQKNIDDRLIAENSTIVIPADNNKLVLNANVFRELNYHLEQVLRADNYKHNEEHGHFFTFTFTLRVVNNIYPNRVYVDNLDFFNIDMKDIKQTTFYAENVRKNKASFIHIKDGKEILFTTTVIANKSEISMLMEKINSCQFYMRVKLTLITPNNIATNCVVVCNIIPSNIEEDTRTLTVTFCVNDDSGVNPGVSIKDSFISSNFETLKDFWNEK